MEICACYQDIGEFSECGGSKEKSFPIRQGLYQPTSQANFFALFFLCSNILFSGRKNLKLSTPSWEMYGTQRDPDLPCREQIGWHVGWRCRMRREGERGMAWSGVKITKPAFVTEGTGCSALPFPSANRAGFRKAQGNGLGSPEDKVRNGHSGCFWGAIGIGVNV